MPVALILFTTALGWSTETPPAYVLEYPGVAFGTLPPEMASPVEGELTDSSGVVQSPPNSTGTEFRIYYWSEDLDPNTRKGDWLVERLRTVLPPDALPNVLLGEPDWVEGSMASPYRETSSIGLVPTVNFNLINENGTVIGVGKAAAVFRNGYSVLIYVLAPGEAMMSVRGMLDVVISEMYLATD